MFPCEMKYMDLFILKMKSGMPRVPSVVLIRDEWNTVTNIIEDRPKGLGGSILVTGQPGIGVYQYSSMRHPH